MNVKKASPGSVKNASPGADLVFGVQMAGENCFTTTVTTRQGRLRRGPKASPGEGLVFGVEMAGENCFTTTVTANASPTDFGRK